MSADQITGVDAAASAGDPQAAARRAKVVEMAQQFEAMLLTQMLRQMRQSMLTEDKEDLGFGTQSMTDTVDSALATSMSKSSRLGVSDFIVRAFERQTQAAAGSPAVPAQMASEAAGTPAGAPARLPVIVAPIETRDPGVPTVVAPAVPPGSVTSAFGWRQDPITGRSRFHSGTDVRMAYGQDVRVPAGGTVAFVGNKSGYGLTVIVDHGNGVETRYAHLSSSPIRQGDVVESGQVIAQSGNSGRSTGPHLHFEVLSKGQAVDPRSGAGLLASAAEH
jgi:murein DD-endopeptidase MepM/ murein hydrolase activator NlpD